MLFRLSAVLLAAVLPVFSPAALAAPSLGAGLQSDINSYLAARAGPEHISAVSLSISLPGTSENINRTAGTSAYASPGAAITPRTLFQIGSVTKSFTAAAILQLEAERKLTIDQTVGQWLPQYPAWKNITIRRLLNMTSDIPTYDDVPSMLAAYAAQPRAFWSDRRLVAVVYPKRLPGGKWLYSNTAYILSQMIVERASGESYAAQIRRRFLDNPAIGLTSTFYVPNIDPEISARMTSGYFFSTDPGNAALAPLLGKDMRSLSLSWAQGAGAIISTPQDVTRWCRALYDGPVLRSKQRRELESLVSLASGKAIPATTPQDSRAFGLGVGEMLMPKMGRVWFYEGMTLGYRMTYVFLPQRHAVIAIGLNSQPSSKQDHVGQLMTAIYNRLHAAGKV